MSKKLSFNYQKVNQAYANACRSIAETYDKNFPTTSERDVDIMFDVSMQVNGNQTGIARMQDDGIANAERVIINHGHKSVTTTTGSIVKGFHDAQLFMAVGYGLAMATLPKSTRKTGGSSQYHKDAIKRLSEYGISVNRTKLLASDKLYKLAELHKDDLAVMRSLKVSDDYERKTKSTTAKRVVIVCSDSCTLADVLRLSGMADQLNVITAYSCPSCKAKFHVKGTTAKVIKQAEKEIAKVK